MTIDTLCTPRYSAVLGRYEGRTAPLNADYAQLGTLGKIPAAAPKDTNPFEAGSPYAGLTVPQLIEALVQANAEAHREIIRLTQTSPEAAAMALGVNKAISVLSEMDYTLVITVKCPDAPYGIVQKSGEAVFDVLDRAVKEVQAYRVGTHKQVKDAA